MARNKNPEETVNLILNVSQRLFIEKGYEHTSIQDIIDQLGGLSKGAIYHHFSSKEDILNAVITRMSEESEIKLGKILERKDLNGKEKLRCIFTESVNRDVQEGVFSAAPNLGQNPQLMSLIIRDSIEVVTPEYILPIIEEGIRDGSIKTDYPKELAEIIMLIGNVWMNPMVFDSSPEETVRKFQFFQDMMKALGVDVIDGELAERLRKLTVIYQKNK
ncbi:MAG: TetR/AcrR family transcriptional regulator [Blautia sp.]|jgi:AcrR family transcriptional regulator